MKKLIAVCMATLLATSLGGCVKDKDEVINVKPPVIENDKISLKNNGYVGKYTMVGAEYIIHDKDFQELVESVQKGNPSYQEGIKIRDNNGLTYDDMGVKSELLCMEITETQDVNICIGGFSVKKATILREDDKTYIKLGAKLFDKFSDKILLGEKDIDENHYLVLRTDSGEMAYFKKLEDNEIVSKIDIKEDGTFDIKGNFKIDYEIEEQETRENVQSLWGSGLRTHGSMLKINEDNTGSYSIGVSKYEEFKLVEEEGKTYIEIINKENKDIREEDGTKHLVEVKQINDKDCIIIYGDDGKWVNTYWTQLPDKEEIVLFNIPGRGEYVWGR